MKKGLKTRHNPKSGVKGTSVTFMLKDGTVGGIMRHNLSRDISIEKFDTVIETLLSLTEAIKYE